MTTSDNKKQSLVKKIRVRLDHKTIITIKDLAKFDFWKEKYPKAVILD